MVRFEPTETTFIEKNPNHVDPFKNMGCQIFCNKLEGHHLEVSGDFLQNYKNGKTKFGPLEIHVTVDFIAKVTEIPRT